MSDIEEVVIPKSIKPKKDTKPEIARQKMKEKRERLKKEKEDSMINEAKNRLAQELEAKKVEEQKKIAEEEEKKKQDPVYQIRMMLEQLTNKEKEVVAKPTKKVSKKKVEVEEPVYVEDEIEIKVPKKRVSKKKVAEVVELPKPAKCPPPPKPRAPRKKKLAVEESPTTQIYGSAPEPEQQEVYYEPTNPLLEKLAARRRMGSYY
jgi:hypothetical protein